MSSSEKTLLVRKDKQHQIRKRVLLSHPRTKRGRFTLSVTNALLIKEVGPIIQSATTATGLDVQPGAGEDETGKRVWGVGCERVTKMPKSSF